MPLEEKVRILENAPLGFLDSEMSDSRGYTIASNRSSNYRLELLLILSGVKPATDIHSDLSYLPHSPSDWLSPSWQKIGNYNSDTNTFVYKDKWVHRTMELLRKLELPHEAVTYTIEQVENFRYGDGNLSTLPKRIVPAVIVAKDVVWLNRAKQAFLSGDEEETGRCYGYPETAVQAYMGRIPRYRDSNESISGTFIASEKHWEKELETVKLWHDTVKKLSQKIYDQTYGKSQKSV